MEIKSYTEKLQVGKSAVMKEPKETESKRKGPVNQASPL